MFDLDELTKYLLKRSSWRLEREKMDVLLMYLFDIDELKKYLLKRSSWRLGT